MYFICKDCGAISVAGITPKYCYIDRSENINQITVEQARAIGLHDFWPAVGLIPRKLTINETIKLNELAEKRKVIMPEFPGEVKYDDITGELVKPMNGHMLVDKHGRITKMIDVLGNC